MPDTTAIKGTKRHVKEITGMTIHEYRAIIKEAEQIGQYLSILVSSWKQAVEPHRIPVSTKLFKRGSVIMQGLSIHPMAFFNTK